MPRGSGLLGDPLEYVARNTRALYTVFDFTCAVGGVNKPLYMKQVEKIRKTIATTLPHGEIKAPAS